MEKLLITLHHSDGYTYSSEQTLPILFNSKEEFIITLEDIVQQYIKDCDSFQIDYEKENKKHKAAHQEYSFFINRQDRSKPSDKIKEQVSIATEKFLQARDKFNSFFTNDKPKETFELGGQTFNFENFTYRKEDEPGKIFIDIPNVFTVDEFFQNVKVVSKPRKPPL